MSYPEPRWKTLKRQRATASDLLAYFGSRTPPIDPFEIARGLDVIVRRVSNPGWAGALQSTEEAAAIWIAAEDADVRQRFTAAHELGHLMLHQTGTLFRDKTFAGTRQETEANNFAADLLMPLPLLQVQVDWVGPHTDRLAEIFWVSRQAMSIRLQKLGIFA
jgi:Zn-dependent peptidase ImmA (M78 family)